MALSLNDPKLKRRHGASQQKPGLPPKMAGMPWRDRTAEQTEHGLDKPDTNWAQTRHKLNTQQTLRTHKLNTNWTRNRTHK